MLSCRSREIRLRSARDALSNSIGMVHQELSIVPDLTVAENVGFALARERKLTEGEIAKRVSEALEVVDLPGTERKKPAELSGGMRKRLGLARAIVYHPEIVLYDEPTTMVDPIMSYHLTSLMLRLKNQLRLTSVVVTHDLELMRQVADKVVFLFEGRVIYFGPVGALESVDHPHVREFLAMDRVDV
mgnify:CR=1 FL=1